MSSNATAQATFQNYIPYRSFEDSPFKDLTYRYFYLEDFEDGNLNTPGVETIQRSVVIGPLGYRSRFVDSVDADDGQLDRSGLNGHSLWSNNNPSLSFVFNKELLGVLPTHVGIVWTDATFTSMVSLSAFDDTGERIGQTESVRLGDDVITGTVMEDCFLGVYYKEGISKVVINNLAPNFEIDHLQYGSESPCRECNRESNMLEAVSEE